jgi:type II secretory pathway pseudopilin PulG
VLQGDWILVSGAEKARAAATWGRCELPKPDGLLLWHTRPEMPSTGPEPAALSRRGISLVEMVMVIVMIGMMLVVALPKAGELYDHTMVRSARTSLTNLYNATRVTARASNQVAVLRLNAGIVVLERNQSFPSTAKDTVTLGGQFHDFPGRYGVTITGPDSIRVDPRGMLIDAGPHTWVFTRDGWSDSVIVNSYGRILR